jgi:hypothetical protein
LLIPAILYLSISREEAGKQLLTGFFADAFAFSAMLIIIANPAIPVQ